ncbi:MAG: heme-binding protein [Flavobacteriaceae bacterium]
MNKVLFPSSENALSRKFISVVFLVFTLKSLSLMAQYETQSYEVVGNIEGGEIRFYPPSMKVKALKSGGFSYLFKYISGGNSEKKKIAMTTPVYMDQDMMEFVLPKKFDPQNTPLPSNPRVEVYESESGYYAAFSYGGYTNPKKEEVIFEKAKTILKKNNLNFENKLLVLVYNSPYHFFNRKNEILIPIEIESK